MGRHDRCCVGTCTNDTRYPERYDIKKHVETLKFHRFPTSDEAKRNTWAGLVNKGRVGFIPSGGSRICSNHFLDGLSGVQDDDSSSDENGEDLVPDMPVSLKLQHLNREFNIRFCTGFEKVETFQAIFDFLLPRSKLMKYWEGPKKSARITTASTSACQQKTDAIITSLAYAEVSSATVSQIWTTWVKLLSKALRYLIIWPSKGQVAATLPDVFKRLYPKVRTIIDCTEIFVETPSSLEVQALLWSDYKHNCTFKFLIAVTPNGAVSWASPCYGERTTDLHIVRDSGFLDLLEPYDTVMADRGFKMKADLTMKRCFLAIPPSAASGTQMTSKDVKETNCVANVRIFVEKAIARIKWFAFLKHEMSLLELPLVDDIIITCCALSNLLPPLVE
eukprot:gene17236-18960_t